MLVNVDIKGLEVVVAAELSEDKVLCQEIIDQVDIHEVNRDRFKLGGNIYREGESEAETKSRKNGRLVAKILKFRTIYGGSPYSFANDPDFQGVSTSIKFWENILDEYYFKYQGIQRWHEELLRTAQKEGKLEIPSGRFYPINPDYSKREPWPLTIIKNYPVQGFGADLVMLARLQAKKLLKESGLEYLMISTIHDSIVIDIPEKNVYNICRLLKQAIEDVPKLCKQVFDYEFKLPLTCELQAGLNKLEMKEIKV